MSNAAIAFDGLAKARRMIESPGGSWTIKSNYLDRVGRALEAAGVTLRTSGGISTQTFVGREVEGLRTALKRQK